MGKLAWAAGAAGVGCGTYLVLFGTTANITATLRALGLIF